MKALATMMLTLLLAMPAAHARDVDAFSQAELDQMLAPVALYPDQVLSHILIAATYPLEIVQAARWVRNNPGLEGEQAVAAVEGMDWDPSVKALVAFPNLVKRMDEDLEWTRNLGDAFLVQEGEVVATIQHLRHRAHDAGNLASSEQVQVVREQETIIIKPARTRVVYVPYYDPWVVYGPWWHTAYPPVYWPRPVGFHHTVGVFYWSHGYYVSPAFFHTSFYWPHRHVIVVNVHHRSHPKRWTHNPRHRRGVGYRRGAPQRTSAPLGATFASDHTIRSQGDVAQRPQQRPQPTQRAQRDWASERRENLRISGATRSQPAPQSRAQAAQRVTTPSQSRQAPVQRAPAPTQRAATPSRPTISAPTSRPEPTQRAAPVQRPAPAQRAAPTQRPAPAQRSAPAQRPTPAQRSAPAPRQQSAPAPVQRPTPAQRVQEDKRIDG